MIFDLHGFGPALAAGTLMTIKLALSALAVGLVLGLLGALAKTSPYKPLQWLGGSYSTISPTAHREAETAKAHRG